jgi:NPCBM-associated, NEW3 domain of alpha-galactosidase
MAGFEPAASCSQSRRANQAAPHPARPTVAYRPAGSIGLLVVPEDRGPQLRCGRAEAGQAARHRPRRAAGWSADDDGVHAAAVRGVRVRAQADLAGRDIYTTLGGLPAGKPALFQITADNVAGPSAAAALSVVPGAAAACAGAKLSLSPSSVTASPGGTVQVTTTLTNGCSTGLSGVDLYLASTGGYQVSPASPVPVGAVAAGATATQTWTVTVPSGASASAQLFGTATFGVGGQTESLAADGSVVLPATSLAAAFGNVGITDDSNTTIGNLDGAGSSFSAQALAADGATPGATVTVGGVPFTWPNVASGDNDNVTASGRPAAPARCCIPAGPPSPSRCPRPTGTVGAAFPGRG